MEVIPTGREPKAIIMSVKQKIRQRILDLTSRLKDVQYSEIIIGAGGVNMSDDGSGGVAGVDDSWRHSMNGVLVG